MLPGSIPLDVLLVDLPPFGVFASLMLSLLPERGVGEGTAPAGVIEGDDGGFLKHAAHVHTR
jgi:hypothetical protein